MKAIKDMTRGSILPQLTAFAIPLILGNLFQIMYNAADSIIVGQFVGDGALAAVGTAGPIMNMAILFISGMCMGAGILISTLFGAKDMEKLEKQISTTFIGGMIFSLVVALVMILLARPVLILINAPEEIIGSAVLYLRVIFVGLIFTFIYNFFANTLRALGDSRTPLYFLVISAVLNILGDLFFVVVLDWGVGGSAVSTVLSEALCCACCAIYIKLRVPVLCLGKKWKVFEKQLLWRTISFGLTSALQQMCVQLGKILVQAIINVQGVAFIAAFTAINRVDDFVLSPEHNIAHATTTFLAQNRGAGNVERVKKGCLCGAFMEMVFALVASVVIFAAAEPVMRLFVEEDSVEVVTLGVSYLKVIAFMYIMPAITNIVQGIFRGMGDLKVTLMSTIANMSARVIAAYVLLNVLGKGFDALAWSNFWGWIFMMLFEVPLLVRMFINLQKKGDFGK
ncbi:MAG: MATE family efflux transporter [Lachnospiraceae bacterium]